MSILTLKQIKKSYFISDTEFPVLRGISLSFAKGEFVSILGESGTGKSTLLNIIAGLDNQYSGDVLVDETPLKSSSEKVLDQYRNQKIGFVFQSFNLVSHLTNLENVMVPLEMTTLSEPQRKQRAKELLISVGLKDHMNKYPNQLSGGQKQRVAIARALSTDPDIIIADEPTGALDSQNTVEILEMLQDIAKRGKLVIQVTHSETAAEYGTRIVHMVDGKIDYDKQIGKASDVEEPSGVKSRNLSILAAIRMAWQHIRYNWRRNLLIIFGGSIGIFSVLLMLGLSSGVQNYMSNQINSKVNPRTILVTQAHTPKNELPKVTKSDSSTLGRLDHVQHTQMGYFTTNTTVNYGKSQAQITLLETYNRTQLRSDLKYGSAPKSNEVVLDQGTATKLNSDVKRIIGNQVTLFVAALNSNNQPVQVPMKVKVSGITTSATDGIQYTTLQHAFKQANLTLTPNFIAVNVDNLGNVKSTETAIKRIIKNGHHQFKITGAEALVNTLNKYVSLAFYLLAGIAAVSLLVSAIMIIVVLYISVSERIKEIGVLRAIGARRSDIRHLFVSEAIFIGFFSGVLGLLFALGSSAILNQIASAQIHSKIVNLLPSYMLFGITASVLISLFAAMAPSAKASKLDPVESLAVE